MQNYLEFLKFSGLNYSQYQFDGVKWLVEKETSEVSGGLARGCGGILADEMGLGKTITMIGTFVSNLLPKTLIVVPLILIEQWKQQILKTTGHRVIVYHGSTKPDMSCLLTSGLDPTLTPASRKTYIVVTTYHTLVSSTILHQIQWNRIVFDEAHHMRNKNTQCFRVACGLKRDICWLLTGTPIQNSEKDLENLCEVARIPFDRVQDYMLKRTKKEVGISMPELTENVEMISWEPDSREHALGAHFHRLLEAKGIGCKLPIMLRAKQVCIMPEMVNTVEMISEVDALTTLSEAVDAVKGDAVAQKKIVIVESSNSKIERAIEIIVYRKMNGNQKIVFCHFHAEIDIIMIRLIDTGMTVGVLDGRSKCSVADVEENDVLIIQIQTGCEGLNLQRFNEIYFIGPHWNPAVEDQAVARCHRIGQLKPVVVYRFIMENLVENSMKSMDTYIRDVQERKRNIVRDMFDI